MSEATVMFLILTFVNAIFGAMSFNKKYQSKYLVAVIMIFAALAVYLLVFAIPISLFTIPSIVIHGVVVVVSILSLIFD